MHEARNRRRGAGPLAAAFAAFVIVSTATAADPAKLALASVNAAVAPLGDSELLYAKHPDRAVPIASLTKLMTALVVLDGNQPLDEWLTIVEREHEPPNNAYSRIRIGSRLQRGSLLRLALMSSENLAAHVLASHYPGGRTAFVEAMNAKARELGMTNSTFVGPSGLSPGNRSTARGLLRLANAAYRHPEIREYTTTSYYRARFRGPRYTLAYGNTDPLVHSSRWQVGMSKTGYLDEAGRCLILVTDIAEQTMVLVLLDSFGTRTPLGDAGRVSRWLRTGQGGNVAAAARAYERRRNADYATSTQAGR